MGGSVATWFIRPKMPPLEHEESTQSLTAPLHPKPCPRARLSHAPRTTRLPHNRWVAQLAGASARIPALAACWHVPGWQ